MVSMEKPDARAVMTYVSSYYHAFTSSQKVCFNLNNITFSAFMLINYFRWCFKLNLPILEIPVLSWIGHCMNLILCNSTMGNLTELVILMGKQEMMLVIYFGTLWTEINNYCKTIQIKSNQIKCWLWRGGKNRITGGKTPWCRVENQQSQPTNDSKCGIKPRPHWWEASVLTSTPSLHFKVTSQCWIEIKSKRGTTVKDVGVQYILDSIIITIKAVSMIQSIRWWPINFTWILLFSSLEKVIVNLIFWLYFVRLKQLPSVSEKSSP